MQRLRCLLNMRKMNGFWVQELLAEAMRVQQQWRQLAAEARASEERARAEAQLQQSACERLARANQALEASMTAQTAELNERRVLCSRLEGLCLGTRSILGGHPAEESRHIR